VDRPLFLDACANLTHESYAGDLDEVLGRAVEAGVAGFLVPGSDLPESLKALALHERVPERIWALAGVHPHHASSWTEEVARGLEALLERPGVVGVGECGLDYFRDWSPRDAQRRALAAQLAIARRRASPLLLHVREAHADFLALWRDGGIPAERALVHCFTGTGDELDALLAEGFTIGLTGWIGDERRGRHLPALVDRIPRDRLVVETDCPYLLPRDLRPRPRNRRNEPAYLPHVASWIARAWGTDLAEVARATTANLRRLFALPEPRP
jgi:TatD DNase family protein